MAVFLLVLYHTDAIKHDPKNPEWEERDRIVLSNGHICPVLYAAMARADISFAGRVENFAKIRFKIARTPAPANVARFGTSSGPAWLRLVAIGRNGLRFKSR